MSLLENTNPFSALGRVATAVTRPFATVLGATEQCDVNGDYSTEFLGRDGTDNPLSLEGSLYFRKGRAQGGTTWKRRLVVLSLADDGNISCYKLAKDDPTYLLKNVYSKLHRQLRNANGEQLVHEHEQSEKNLRLFLPNEVPWIVKDLENDSSTFVVEVPTEDPSLFDSLIMVGESVHDTISHKSRKSKASLDPLEHDDDLSEYDDDDYEVEDEDITVMSHAAKQQLQTDFRKARSKHKPLRFYFKCPRKGNEKALWMRAFTKLERLSPETRKRRNFLAGVAHIKVSNSRIRNDAGAQFARDTRELDMALTRHIHRNASVMYLHSDIEAIARRQSNERREFRVTPTYCYPYVWMTATELREECNLPSMHFHDLRLPSLKGKEIGTLRVEVLQCMGLPKLDRASESDAVVYMVCGSYAFATDVIPDNANPMWLRKTRRACIFPIFHGYARLFVGVFDDDGPGKDDMAGRVVLDLARIRPGCRYDVTLPLRLSAHVYSRRQRGAVRLRFQLDWTSEKAALMSYLPKKIKLRNVQPNKETTVLCTDPSSFRNVALTVHGAHLPGKFSFNQFRATIKELNFTRKMVIKSVIKDTIKDTVNWVNPALSLYVFLAWMHCIYENSFALVPAYFMTFIMLHMMRNYAIYGIDGPSQRGFVPPTWDELFMVFMRRRQKGDVYAINQMEMRSRQLYGSSNHHSSSTDDSIRFDESASFRVETHTPIGKSLFRWLGFLESEEVLEGMTADERHLEFPFAPGTIYPKFRLKEALVTKKKTKELEENIKASDDKSENGEHKEHNGDLNTFSLRDFEMEFNDTSERLDDLPEEVGPPSSSHSLHVQHEHENGGSHSLRHASSLAEEIPKNDVIALQDIDAVTQGGKLTDDLNEAKEKMHEVTYHLFNDRTHLVANSDSVPFSFKPGSRKKDVNKSLEKILQTGAYSHSNPVISRVGLYLTPVIRGALSFICLFRALFNVFTWRDPFLSFWVSIVGTFLSLVLFIFPWRIVLFIAGVIVVGPQNWIFRLVRERHAGPQGEEPPKKDEFTWEAPKELPDDRPLFQSHPHPNTRFQPVNPERVDKRGIHHVVVPYSPLMYQRFYDWPPEPEYSHVKDATKHAVHQRRILLNRRKTSSDGPDETNSIHPPTHNMPVLDTLGPTTATDILFDDQYNESLRSTTETRRKNNSVTNGQRRRTSHQNLNRKEKHF